MQSLWHASWTTPQWAQGSSAGTEPEQRLSLTSLGHGTTEPRPNPRGSFSSRNRWNRWKRPYFAHFPLPTCGSNQLPGQDPTIPAVYTHPAPFFGRTFRRKRLCQVLKASNSLISAPRGPGKKLRRKSHNPVPVKSDRIDRALAFPSKNSFFRLLAALTERVRGRQIFAEFPMAFLVRTASRSSCARSLPS